MALSNAQKLAGRKSLALLTAIIAANAVEAVPLAVSLTITPLSQKADAFSASVTVGTDVYVMSDSNGKVKSFKDVDQVLSYVTSTKMVPAVGDLDVTIENPQVLAPNEVIGGDAQARFKRSKAAFERAQVVALREKAEREADIVAYTAEGYATGSPRAQAFLAELVAQQLALENASTYNADEIARLAALITP